MIFLAKEYYYNEHDENQVTKLYKKKKKKKLKRKFKVFCLFVFILLIVGYFVSGVSKVKTISVVGNKDVNKESIKEAAGITKQTTYLFIDKSKVEDAIKQVALVKKAEVTYDILGNVTIKIEESNKVAYCVIDKKTYVIDELGSVVEAKDESVIETLKTSPKLSNFKTLEFLETFAKAYAGIPEIIKNETSDIIYSPKDADETRIEFVLDNGKKLIVRVEDMANQLSRFSYEAFMTTYDDKCVFEFLGEKNVYMRECEDDE